ncbi:hypothetical protein B9Z55_016525 [Caenorhabditis nigoni]|uniref:Uncharacterized protein n=1 Tax=Caenorhabditis nigoni TaxID=1611254 RepID=A0A2G5T5V8_9PELO|nr:hypothetical protein B9Z55_016525 [Caenorhabditis nigoni]
MSTEAYPSYTLAGLILLFPPQAVLINANRRCGLFYYIFSTFFAFTFAFIHVIRRGKNLTNDRELTRRQRIKWLKIGLVLLLACLTLQHSIASYISKYFWYRPPDYYSEDPFYWPSMYSQFALGPLSTVLTYFLAERSIYFFHPSDFLDVYYLIVFTTYYSINYEEENAILQLYLFFYYYIIKGIFIVFLDPNSIVDTCNETETVIIKTWTGRKYKGHPWKHALSIVYCFTNSEECVEGKVWEKSERQLFLTTR